ncbi:MAG TPA: GNAT family N-acetyltransferase [Solirubrobacteraceae bacterium]
MSAPRPEVPPIALVGERDLPELLPLLRAYCDFYETAPGDAALLELARRLLADPAREGVQLLAREDHGRAVGFASVFWAWDTTEADRVGIMNDLYVAPGARGGGFAEGLIRACGEQCALHGAARLDWVTGPGNARAQAVYDRVGAVREEWVNYTIRVARTDREPSPGEGG